MHLTKLVQGVQQIIYYFLCLTKIRDYDFETPWNLIGSSKKFLQGMFEMPNLLPFRKCVLDFCQLSGLVIKH